MWLVGLHCLSDPFCVFGLSLSYLCLSMSPSVPLWLRLLVVWILCSVSVLGVFAFLTSVAGHWFFPLCDFRCPLCRFGSALSVFGSSACLTTLPICRILLVLLCGSSVQKFCLSRFCLFSVWTLLFVGCRSSTVLRPHIAQTRALCLPSCMPKISFLNTRDLMSLDQTCGFPGEGPFWSCISANVNSVNSHPDCLHWKDDLVCLQETRLSQSSIDQHRYHLHSTGRDFFYAKLLQASRQKNGIKHIPHGGTACIASKDFCRAFSIDDDSTGLGKDWRRQLVFLRCGFRFFPD